MNYNIVYLLLNLIRMYIRNLYNQDNHHQLTGSFSPSASVGKKIEIALEESLEESQVMTGWENQKGEGIVKLGRNIL